MSHTCTDPATQELTLDSFREIGRFMPGGFFVYPANESEEILFLNDIVLHIFGCETLAEFKELTGGTFRGMIHEEDREEVEDTIRQQVSVDENGLDHVEYRIVRKDGTIRWVDDYGRLARIKDYGDVYVALIRDITEFRAQQEEKRKIKNDLALVKQRNEITSSFIFSISHDLRTPMNAVMGFTAMAKRHLNEPELLTDYLDKVDEYSHYMLAMIDDVLEVGSIESGRIQLAPEPTSLVDEINSLLEMQKKAAADKELTLESHLDLGSERVFVDPMRFRRILLNLLENAITYSNPGGHIEVKAGVQHTTTSGFGRYVISVTDQGSGMSEEFMQRMFKPFEREEKTASKNHLGGTGLGLTIVRRLLDMMGGSIRVTSTKGQGSSFTIELPLRRVQDGQEVKVEEIETAAPEETTPDPSENSGACRILLVEDIEINRLLAECVLRDSGFLVESVEDGCDAVEAVKKHPAGYYDCVLMDIQMPVMNGYEATRAIRALDREDARTLPIIALSANARAEDRAMSRKSGMDDHVAKPFDIGHLLAVIGERTERKAQ